MKITWLGHSGFRIEIEDQTLLIDPWFTDNPVFPEGRKDEAVAGATHILLTHGHGDHSGDAVGLSKSLDVPVVGIYDLMSHWEAREGIKVIGFNKGGTVALGGAAVTMVNAVHSSSIGGDAGPLYAGRRGRLHDRGRRPYDLCLGRHRPDGGHGLDGRIT